MLLGRSDALRVRPGHASPAAERSRPPPPPLRSSKGKSFTSVILPTTISPTSPLYLGEGQVAQPVGRLVPLPRAPGSHGQPRAAGPGRCGPSRRRQPRPFSPGLQRSDAHQLVHPLHGAGHRGDELLLLHVGAVAPAERAAA